MILYVFGAGGGAVELLEETKFFDRADEILGSKLDYVFIEDKPKAQAMEILSSDGYIYPIFSTKQMVRNVEYPYGTVSAYNPAFKEKIDKLFPELTWVNCISANAYVDANVLANSVGLNMRSGAFVGSTVKLGRHVKINYGAKITHDCKIGDYSFISINASVCSGTKIGSKCLIGAGAVILDKGITIGDGAVVAAGSVVTKDVAAGKTVMGVPAKEVVGRD